MILDAEQMKGIIPHPPFHLDIVWESETWWSNSESPEVAGSLRLRQTTIYTRSNAKASTTSIIEEWSIDRAVFYDRINRAVQGEKIDFRDQDIKMAESSLRKIERKIEENKKGMHESYTKKHKRILLTDIERMRKTIVKMNPKTEEPWTQGWLQVMKDLINYFSIL